MSCIIKKRKERGGRIYPLHPPCRWSLFFLPLLCVAVGTPCPVGRLPSRRPLALPSSLPSRLSCRPLALPSALPCRIPRREEGPRRRRRRLLRREEKSCIIKRRKARGGRLYPLSPPCRSSLFYTTLLCAVVGSPCSFGRLPARLPSSPRGKRNREREGSIVSGGALCRNSSFILCLH